MKHQKQTVHTTEKSVNTFPKTDLALEAQEYLQAEAGDFPLPGIRVSTADRRGIRTTTVKILDAEGAKQLHKPVGTYVTLELEDLNRHKLKAFARIMQTLAGELAMLMHLQEDFSVLVVGLGNPDVTPDSIGPRCLKRLLVTRHLMQNIPESYGKLRTVSALQPGVMGSTGMESAEIVKAVVDATRPDCVIVIDALAAKEVSRICSTVQLTDTGLIPGSGVGNRRSELTQQVLGVPVFAIGTPTVTEASVLLSGRESAAPDNCIVTPRDIDAKVRQIAALIAGSLNLVLHSNLSRDQISQFVETLEND